MKILNAKKIKYKNKKIYEIYREFLPIMLTLMVIYFQFYQHTMYVYVI